MNSTILCNNSSNIIITIVAQCCLCRLYGVESEFLSPTAIKARLPILRTEDLLVGNSLTLF